MFASEKLKELLTVPTIEGVIDTFSDDFATYPMIVFDSVVPNDWGANSRSINYYKFSTINGGLNYGDYPYTINCRARTAVDAMIIQSTVFEELNRVTRDGFNMVCSILQIISPADETDNYNAPIEVRIKTNGGIN